MKNSSKKLVMDDIDWKLMEELYRDPRIPIKTLSEKLGIHRNTVASKLDKKYFTQILIPNYDALEIITAYVFSKVKPNRNNKKTAQLISTFDGVESVSVISGEWDFIIKIRAKSIEQIGHTIIEDLKEVCDQTVTSFNFWSFNGENPFGLIKSE